MDKDIELELPSTALNPLTGIESYDKKIEAEDIAERINKE